MTDISEQDERKARNWLATAVCYTHQQDAIDARHRATILALLDRPRTTMPRPEDVPASVMVPIADQVSVPYAEFRAVYRALWDHYNPPPAPKKVEAWAVVSRDGNYWYYTTKEFAEDNAEAMPGSRIVRLVEADQ